MQKNILALIFIILGLILMIIPAFSSFATWIVGAITGISVIFLGIGLLVAGYVDREISTTMSILEIIFGIIALVLGIAFIVNPAFFTTFLGLIIDLIGLLLIISGIVAIISKTGGTRWYGVVPLILGIIYIIIGNMVKGNEIFLGILIGLWLLISGIFMFLEKE